MPRNEIKSALDEALPRCPQCKKPMGVSIAFNDRHFEPICIPCVTKNLKGKGRKK